MAARPEATAAYAATHADHEVIDRMDQSISPPTPAAQRAAPADPPPVVPQPPLPFDCCESGCDRCVYEIHADELAHYQSELAAWRKRNPDREPGGA